MELRQLEYFLAVAEEQSFTQAARRVHIVQSALSASIRLLESELSTVLFARTTRSVKLTPAGRALMCEARRVLAAVQSAREAVAAADGLLRGTLTVGTLQVFPQNFCLAALLHRFRQRYPGVEIRLRQAGSASLMSQVQDGLLDLAFVALFGPAPEGLRTQVLGSDPMQLICALDHPLAEREQVALDELTNETFVDFQRDWGVRLQADRIFASAHVERRSAFEVNDVATLLNLVKNRLGIALVPRAVAVQSPHVRAVALSTPAPTWDMGVAYTPHPQAAARALLEMIPGAEPVIADVAPAPTTAVRRRQRRAG